MSIQEYRGEIDRIDPQIIALFTRRMEVAAKIARYKQEQGLPVRDPKREQEKLQAVAAQSDESIRDYTPMLFSALFALSRSYQNRLQGAEEVWKTRLLGDNAKRNTVTITLIAPKELWMQSIAALQALGIPAKPLMIAEEGDRIRLVLVPEVPVTDPRLPGCLALLEADGAEIEVSEKKESKCTADF